MRTDGGLVPYCVYSAPGADSIRSHAAAAGIPADRVQEIDTSPPVVITTGRLLGFIRPRDVER